MIDVLLIAGILLTQLPQENLPPAGGEELPEIPTETEAAPIVGEGAPTPTLKLVAGYAHVLKIPLLKRAIVGNKNILTVDIIGKDELLLNPIATGGTNLIIRTKDGLETEYNIVILPKDAFNYDVRTIAVKVYVIEILKTAEKDLGVQWVDNFNLVEDPIPVPGLTEVGPIKRQTPVWMTLRALVSEGKARILSSPMLITTEGNPAEFFVGGQIPVVVAGGFGQMNIQWKPYGVKLTITPWIDLKNYIDLRIEPSISDLDWANAVQVSGYTVPAIREKKLKARVRIRPGVTIGLGGLINTKTEYKKSGVPLLSALPIIGNLFSIKSTHTRSAEVVFLVTPVILPKSRSMVEVWDRFESKTYELPLLLREETVLVPIDALAKILGCRVKKGENEVIFTYKGKKVRINYDTQSMLVNDQLNEIYVENYYGHMMVELEVFKKIFADLEILWDKYENILHIVKHVRRL